MGIRSVFRWLKFKIEFKWDVFMFKREVKKIKKIATALKKERLNAYP